ncbi:hypothetical protein [Marinobacter salexigens]|uniref:Uncharacterized protein n=1 Tax=Marinobacter salexigens TaxID=1925763 RepID=A0ABS6A905_9GAMM|nr:hypothetical protein [Marinobacter salexigens]MBU2874668.1 hypothetical protein [Marinobacter salexigens]
MRCLTAIDFDLLTTIDPFTPESLGFIAERSLKGTDVEEALTGAIILETILKC